MKTLCRYVTQYRRHRADAGLPHRLVPVEITGVFSGSSALTVLLPGGRRIEVNRGFDAGTLRQLITVLEPA